MRKIYFLVVMFFVSSLFYCLPVRAAGENAIVKIISTDSTGQKVANVEVHIYQQLTDVNKNKVLGEEIGSLYIGETGSGTAEIWLGANKTATVAMQYFQNYAANEIFTLWDQKISTSSQTTANLVYSSVKIVLQNSKKELLKEWAFDIYSNYKDVKGKITTGDILYENITTDRTGQFLKYLSPGSYSLRLRYNTESTDLADFDKVFKVEAGKQTNLNLTLSDIKVKMRDANGVIKPEVNFKVYKESAVDNEYKYWGGYNTGDTGEVVLYLPAGDYQVNLEDSSGQYTKTVEFILNDGEEKEVTYDISLFKLKVLDVSSNPLAKRNVKFNLLSNGEFAEKFTAQTDANGQLQASLEPGTYNVLIEGIYRDTWYKLPMFIIGEKEVNMEYKLSKAQISFTQRSGALIKNQAFSLYYYTTDEEGNTQPGDKVDDFSTSTTGYFEIYLPPGKYIIQTEGNNDSIISVQEQKYNNISVTLFSSAETPPAAGEEGAEGEEQEAPPERILNELYQTDTDEDGLFDFEETYMWGTKANTGDSDGDGYNDKTEIRNGYNPNGKGKFTYKIYSYGRPRLISLSYEQQKALYLKSMLERKLGKGNIRIDLKDWPNAANAFIYGGYTVDEVIKMYRR